MTRIVDPDARRKAVDALAEQLDREVEARALAKSRRARKKWRIPSEEERGVLSDLLSLPREDPRYLIDKLLGWNHNALFGGPYKSGKTTAGLGAVQALVDKDEFLGRQTHLPDGAQVAWWNAEMDPADWYEYAEATGMVNTARVVVWHLRGGKLNLLDEFVARQVVRWLKRNEVKVWFVDSWRRLCAWAGVGQNDNDMAEQLTAAIDDIKRRAGVQAVLVLAHTGRGQQEEGQEHVRGATALDDWVDARWIYVRQRQDRFFYAEGRRVSFDEAQVVSEGGMVSVAGGGRRARRQERQQEASGWVAQYVEANPGAPASAIDSALKVAYKITNVNELSAARKKAVELGLVHVRPSGTKKPYHPGPDPKRGAKVLIPRPDEELR